MVSVDGNRFLLNRFGSNHLDSSSYLAWGGSTEAFRGIFSFDPIQLSRDYDSEPDDLRVAYRNGTMVLGQECWGTALGAWDGWHDRQPKGWET